MISIALGGFLGALARYCFYVLVESRLRQPKFANWLVNSIGSFALGAFIGTGTDSLFWMTGFLGAFTTFSTMALDAVKDFEDGRLMQASGYLAAALTSGILLFSAGYHFI